MLISNVTRGIGQRGRDRVAQGTTHSASMRMHLPENRTIRLTVVRNHGDKLGVRFELADPHERERLLLWVFSISTGTVQAPLSIRRLTGRLAARCLK